MMNIYDFLLSTPKEIKAKVKGLGIKSHNDIRTEESQFMSQFGLSPDSRVKFGWVDQRYGTHVRFYITFSLPPIKNKINTYDLPLRLSFTGSSCAVKIVLEDEEIDIIREYLGLFDSRKDYSNLEFGVHEVKLCSDIFDDNVLKPDHSLKEVDQRIQNYYTKTAPLVYDYLDKCNDGTIESLWNKHNPLNKLKKGNDIFTGYYFSVNIYVKLRTEIPSFDFEDLAIVASVIGRGAFSGTKNQDLENLLYSDTITQQEKIDLLNKIKSEFLGKQVSGSPYDTWTREYVAANEEFMKRVEEIKKEIGINHNINPKYITIFGARPEIFKDVPSDGYYK